MNTPAPSLLLCTNGSLEGRPALDYGVWLAEKLHLPVQVLGIIEAPEQKALVQQTLHTLQTQLEAAGIAHTTQVQTGRAREVICAVTHPEHHLVVLGPLGRPKWRRWLQGRAFRRMMPNLVAPFIYTPQAHPQLERILVCTGALEYAVSAECWALSLARALGAQLTILHIAEAVHYHYPSADQMMTHWQDLLNADIPQARHLRALLEQAQAQGLTADVQIRHGNIVHEIVAAARAGKHDLVVMGSKYSSHSLRGQYLPDVTAEVMETLKRPVLVVRAEQPCFLAE